MEEEAPTKESKHDDRWSDEEFRVWVLDELIAEAPILYEKYQDVVHRISFCIVKWRQRYQGNAPLWKRVFKKDRVIKEAMESVPIIHAVDHWMSSYSAASLLDGEAKKKVTIIDLCSGKGYLSMLLSEYLKEPELVNKCVLIDKAWPLCNSLPKPHHISWEHIYGDRTKSDCIDYYESWPIPLVTSKQDMKQSATLRQMKDRYSKHGPILILAIHLCGTLSIQAIRLFQSLGEAKVLMLKPCCLPGIYHQKRHEMFQIGGYCFPTQDVCASGKWASNQKVKGRWKGPPRWHLEGKFHKWCQYLFEGISHDGTVHALQSKIQIQSQGGYQNTFLFAEKIPISESVWDEMEKYHKEEGEEEESKELQQPKKARTSLI